ncbi:phospholipid scramblase 1, partial [Cladochytrium tenue]
MGSAANSRDDLSSQKFNFNKSEAQHFWSEAEAVSYVHWINERLEGDSLVGSKIPIPPNGAALFAALWDGLLLARLVQLARPESIDWEKFDPAPRLQIQAAENIRHALEGAARTGVRIHNVGPDDIIKRTPHLCLGLIWQIIKIGLLSNVAIGTNLVSDSHEDLPGVLRRARMATGDSEGRPPPANATSAAERALLGWLNAAAAATGCPVTARNFGADLADGVVLAHAVEFVDGGRNGTEARALLGAADGGEAPEERRARAERVLEAAGRIGCRHFATADDIAAGRREPNLALVAVLHNAHAAAAADGLAAARQQVRDAQAEQAQATARREKARAEELERRLREAAQEASGVDQEREDAGRRARRAEEEAAVERRRAEDATRATAAAVQERDGAVRRLDELAAGRAELEQRVQELTVQAAAAGELLRLSEERTAVERERGRAEAARDAEELGIERDVAARRAEDAEERLARTMAKLESLAMVEAQLAAAQRQLEDRESFLSGELSATREQLRAAQTELSQVTDDARGRATAREEGSRRLAQAEARVVALTEELDEVRGELGGRADRADERAEQTRQELAAMRDQLRDAEIRAAEVQRLERVAKFEIQEVQERA